MSSELLSYSSQYIMTEIEAKKLFADMWIAKITSVYLPIFGYVILERFKKRIFDEKMLIFWDNYANDFALIPAIYLLISFLWR